MQGLGYKELLDYLDGDITEEEAIYRIKRDTRHFAKRQLTWFRREQDVIWIQKENFTDDSEILDFIQKILMEKEISMRYNGIHESEQERKAKIKRRKEV